MRFSTPPLLLSSIINLVFTAIEGLLVLRILLRLFAASPSAPFTKWVLDTTDSLLRPFVGIFPTTISNGSIIEFSTIFALIIYALLAYLITELISTLSFYGERRRIHIHED